MVRAVTEYQEAVTEYQEEVVEYQEAATEYQEAVTEYQEADTEYQEAIYKISNELDVSNLMPEMPSCRCGRGRNRYKTNNS